MRVEVDSDGMGWNSGRRQEDRGETVAVRNNSLRHQSGSTLVDGWRIHRRRSMAMAWQRDRLPQPSADERRSGMEFVRCRSAASISSPLLSAPLPMALPPLRRRLSRGARISMIDADHRGQQSIDDRLECWLHGTTTTRLIALLLVRRLVAEVTRSRALCAMPWVSEFAVRGCVSTRLRCALAINLSQIATHTGATLLTCLRSLPHLPLIRPLQCSRIAQTDQCRARCRCTFTMRRNWPCPAV